jgi:hypothetical protein
VGISSDLLKPQCGQVITDVNSIIFNFSVKVTKMKTSKRYTITIFAGIILAGLAILSVLKGMEGLASACVGGILTILTTYIWGETKRPSNNPEP